MKFSNVVKSTLFVSVLGCLAMGLAPTAYAATSQANLDVSANVSSNCIVSSYPIAFTNYTGTVANAQADLSITCTKTTGYTVALNAGTTPGATFNSRKMASSTSTDLLPYSLYSDASRTTYWGDTTANMPPSTVGNGTVQTLTVYGQIAGGYYVTPGVYSDTVVVTVTY